MAETGNSIAACPAASTSRSPSAAAVHCANGTSSVASASTAVAAAMTSVRERRPAIRAPRSVIVCRRRVETTLGVVSCTAANTPAISPDSSRAGPNE